MAINSFNLSPLEINHRTREICHKVLEHLNQHVLPDLSWIIYLYFEPTLNADEVQEFAKTLPNHFDGDLYFDPRFNRQVRARCGVCNDTKLIIAAMMCVCPKKLIELGCDPFLSDGMTLLANDCYNKSGNIAELLTSGLMYYFNEPFFDVWTSENMQDRCLRIHLPENFTHGLIKMGFCPKWDNFPEIITHMPNEFKCDLLTNPISKEELDAIDNEAEYVTFRGLRFAHCGKRILTNCIFQNKVYCYDFR